MVVGKDFILFLKLVKYQCKVKILAILDIELFYLKIIGIVFNGILMNHAISDGYVDLLICFVNLEDVVSVWIFMLQFLTRLVLLYSRIDFIVVETVFLPENTKRGVSSDEEKLLLMPEFKGVYFFNLGDNFRPLEEQFLVSFVKILLFNVFLAEV